MSIIVQYVSLSTRYRRSYLSPTDCRHFAMIISLFNLRHAILYNVSEYRYRVHNTLLFCSTSNIRLVVLVLNALIAL